VTQSWTEIRKETARRRRIRVLGLVAVIIACASFSPYARRSSNVTTEVVSSPTVGGGRSVVTAPFELATADVSGSTTIPDGMLNDVLTLDPTTSTTSTTIAIPAPPENDPMCRSTTFIVEALRILTGPGGTVPDSLRAGAAQFDQAADALDAARRPDFAKFIALIRKVADEIQATHDPDQVPSIFNQILAPTDPGLRPLAKEFTDHLRQSCPELLSIEP